MAFFKFPHNTQFDFVGFRFITFLISGLMLVFTLGGYFVNGLNYGIDFHGGMIIEMRTPKPADFSQLRADLSPLVKGEISVQEFGSPYDVLLRIERPDQEQEHSSSLLSEKQESAHLIEKIKEKLGNEIEYRRIETIGPKVGAELIRNGLIAIGWSLLAMLIYVWIRFEWQFGVCAIVALMHDCVGIFCLFTLFQLEFNETAIVALLITASYSINDTVVVFDRIRENRKKHKKMTIQEMINRSLNETLSRTTLTSATTLIALIMLYCFGGHIISAFSLPIIVGIAVGTYSSIFLAAPLLIYLQSKNHVSSGETF